MEQKTIIERNLDVYLRCESLLNQGRPFYTSRDAYELIDCIKDYEGWGRCRKLIDNTSEETAFFKEHLKDFCTPMVVKEFLNDAQSASLTAFYTPTDIAKVITDFALTSYEKLNGKPAQTLLDPSCGTGAFLTGIEDYGVSDLYIDTCEKDLMTRTILTAKMQAIAFLRDDRTTNKYLTCNLFNTYESKSITCNKQDIIVSNMPFGNIKVYDKAFAKLGFIAADSCKAIHNYYFMKSLHLLNRGGIMAFITTRGFLSSNSNKEFREEMLRHGKVISIVRLPDNLFKTVDVGSDLIVYQKKPHPTLPEGEGLQRVFLDGWAEDEDLQLAEGMVIPNCEHRIKKNQYGKPVQNYKYKGTDMAADLKTALISSAAISLPIEGEGRGEGLLHLHYGNHFFMFFE